MKAVFISDAHIRNHLDPNLLPLLEFLNYLKGRIERLYIVGDLFDTWFAFPKAVFDEYIPALGALDALKRSGVDIVYVTGNHDFEMGYFFETILKAEIYDTQTTLDQDGLRAFVAHGDMVNPHDKKYRRLRKVLRAPITRWLGRQLPSTWVWRIAQHLSTNFTGDEIARRMSLRDVFSQYAAARQDEGYNVVILGHLHIPVFSQEKKASEARTYVNLGDWVKWRTFLSWDEGQLELRQWVWHEGKERIFNPERA